MAGFLTATVTLGQAGAANLSGDATLSAAAFQSYLVSAGLSGGGVLDTPTKPQAALAAALSGAGALTGPISPKYTLTLPLAGGGSLAAGTAFQYPLAVNFSGGGALSVNVTAVTLLDFTDTFNRANNASPGAPWIAPIAPYVDWSISGNMLVNTDATNGDRIFYGPLSKDGQKVTITMGFDSAGAGFAMSVWTRTNDDRSVLGGVGILFASYDGVTCYISLQMADAAGNPAGTQPGRQDVTFVAGDTFSVASLGDRAVMLKNGALILADNDPTHTISTGLNAGERSVLITSEPGYAIAGTLKIDQVRIQEIDVLPTYANLASEGTLTVEIERWLKFVPFNEENAPTALTFTPAACDGAYATLIGSGGGGGRGHFAAATNRGGGGGGGGAGKVERVYVPVASIGAYYSVARPLGGASQTNGAAATFITQAGVNLSAGGGGKGGDGTSGAVGAAGTAGTATASGVTATLRNGTAGGAGGAQGGGAGVAGTANATGGAPGGGGGGGLSSVGVRGAGSAGGNSATVSGGAAATTSSPAGKAGTNAAAGNAGGGGGGASIQSTNTNSQIGGAAGVYGAGGGGSSCGNNAYSAGGKGGDSYTLIEWVGTGYYPVPVPVLLDASYTQTTPYAGCSAATFDGMTNGNASGASGQTGTISATNPFIQADLGSVMAIGDIIIGYDYLNNLPGGFGTTYTQGLLLQGSNDGSAWTTITTMPTYASTGSSNGLVTIHANTSCRYVRLVYSGTGYAAATEFAIYSQ